MSACRVATSTGAADSRISRFFCIAHGVHGRRSLSGHAQIVTTLQRHEIRHIDGFRHPPRFNRRRLCPFALYSPWRLPSFCPRPPPLAAFSWLLYLRKSREHICNCRWPTSGLPIGHTRRRLLFHITRYPNSFTLAIDFRSSTKQRILGSWTLAASMTEPLMLELLKVEQGFVLIW